MALHFSSWDRFPATFMTIAACLFSASVYAAEESGSAGSDKVHPVAETKKAAKGIGHGVKDSTKVIGHGVRDGTRAVGHKTKEVTREVGHAFRDGAHEVGGKKD